MTKSYNIKIELYNDFPITVVFSDTIPTAIKENKFLSSVIGNEANNYSLAGGYTFVFTNNQNHEIEHYIAISTTRGDMFETVAHESFHMTKKVMDIVGCKLTESSEEAYAYLLSYIIRKIRACYKNYKKSIENGKEQKMDAESK